MRLVRLIVRVLSRLSDFYTHHIFRQKIDRALSLHQRGEARRDGLRLESARTTLHIGWIARNVHPWDSTLPRERLEQLFAQQCLADTEAAVSRLFNEVPVLDAIEVKVRKDQGGPALMLGIVKRSEVGLCSSQSIAMKLRSLGLRFRLHNLRLEPIDASD